MKKAGKFNKIGAALAIFVVIAVAITGTIAINAGGYEPPKKPKILEFSATPAQLTEAGVTTLKWNVIRATKVEVTGLEKMPECKGALTGSMEVIVPVTTEFTLTAFSPNGNVTKKITVTVGPVVKPMVINYFKASKTTVIPGDTVMLSWDVAEAKSVEITGFEHDEEILPLVGEMEVIPTATTDYTLTATDANGKTKQATLTVVVEEDNADEVTSFTASAPKNGTCYISGEQVAFNWVTKNAVSCEFELKDINGKVTTLKNRPLTGSINHFPNRDTTYTVRAIDKDGKVATKSIVIHVN
jgi:hypothetical protein